MAQPEDLKARVLRITRTLVQAAGAFFVLNWIQFVEKASCCNVPSPHLRASAVESPGFK
jgi:hypothetical protein